MFYPRKILPVMEKEIDSEEIVVLTGMRQVGKTTLLKYIFDQIKSKNKVFLDAENPLHRRIFEEENYDNVWSNLREYNLTNKQKSYLFVDEIQNLPSITRVIKYLYDHYEVKFFLTGSSSFYLKNLFPESMAGRKLVFELFPLTFPEFLVFKGRKRESDPKDFSQKARGKNKVSFELYQKDYQEYMRYGGFPRVVLEESKSRKSMILEEVFSSYFEKDVKSLADFKQISKMRDLILLLSLRTGSRVDITKLSSELSLSRETVYSYLSFLVQTYFISLAPKHTKSLDRSAAGTKKLFFCDSGMVSVLGQISQGQLLENSVFQSLRPDHEISYYRGKSGNEIDFILDAKVALEVKNTASKRDVENLKRTTRSLSFKESYIVSLKYSDLDKVILAQDL